MRETIKLGLVLFLVASISAIILGVSNMITGPVIAETIEMQNKEARQSVLAEADDFKKVKVEGFEGIVEVFEGIKTDETIGYTIKSKINGFSGPIEILTGIDCEGNVTGMKVLSNSETPGLGKNAENEEFQTPFIGKNSKDKVEVSKTEPQKSSEIQALTGATITSKAVANGVNLALEYFESALVK